MQDFLLLDILDNIKKDNSNINIIYIKKVNTNKVESIIDLIIS